MVTVNLPCVTEVSFLLSFFDSLVFCRLPQHAYFLFLQGLEEMSSRKSHFLRMEHAQEAEMS